MIEAPTHYVLNSVSPELASDYLNRVYNVRFIPKGGFPHTLIINYFQGKIPSCFESIAKKYPENCFICQNNLGTPVVVCGTLFQLTELIGFSKTLKDLTFFKQLESSFNTVKSPSLTVGNEKWDSQSPKVMAILNATPDSFYDGGTNFKLDNYGDVAAKMIEDGADIIDIGGESTRPGSLPVSADEEIKRILPAVEQIRSRFNIPISVDTVKPDVADLVLSKGANLINDISGLSGGKKMIETIVRHNASYCLMHTQGPSVSMQKNPTYSDVVSEIYSFFSQKIKLCQQYGLKKNHITLDPGIGFGKTIHHNLDLLRFLDAFNNLDCLILLGTSNKSFIGKLLNREGIERLSGTMITQSLGWLKHASIFRVHEIKENYDAVKMTRVYTHSF